MNNIPLAERLRPQSIKDILGQDHILGAKGALAKFIDTGRIPSCIFWGPPGSGKTSLALALAKELDMNFNKISAISSGVKEMRAIINKSDQNNLFTKKGTILFVDEIHRFNKLQQDALLESVEKGIITLVGATTENPSFEINNALLSRSLVFKLQALDYESMKELLLRALERDEILKQSNIVLEEHQEIIAHAGGDARKLYNLLEFLVENNSDDSLTINNEMVKNNLRENIQLFDRQGEFHYDTISAFIKSVRGSDVNASLYYLARMLVSGEDPKFICRRLIILAAEDIGLANPNALLLANACSQAIERIGMPEGRIPLSETVIYLATSQKSNSAYVAIDKAMNYVRANPNAPIPLHLRNAVTKLHRDEGYGKDYLYPHDAKNSWIEQQYLPNGVKEKFYDAGRNEQELRMIQKWNQMKH